MIVIHLGKKPSSGGIPLRDSKIIDIYSDVFIEFIFDFCWLTDIMFKYIVIKSGVIINE